jgi:hypothetical protein
VHDRLVAAAPRELVAERLRAEVEAVVVGVAATAPRS